MHLRNALATSLFAFMGTLGMQGQQVVGTAPAARIVGQVDASRLAQLHGNTHPATRFGTDLGLVSPDLAMNRMLLVLQRSPAQEAALQQFMAEQYDPQSPNFHHWLSAEQFGALYGVGDADLAKLTTWLQSQGFTVENVSKGRVTIEFSGTAKQVQQAFHTEMHRYSVNGVGHLANNADPQIPEALVPVVVGISSLHDFFAKSQMHMGQEMVKDAVAGKFQPAPVNASATNGPIADPQYSSGGQYLIVPYDFATIYNLLPTWNSGINGTGVAVAIVARGDIHLYDVAKFQQTFGLPLSLPTVIHNGTDPGFNGDQAENSLDAEWAAATAPGARIDLVVSGSTSSTDGVALSSEYIIDNQIAPVMSASYGLCELYTGTAGNSFYNQLWQQGAAEGISIFVSSGDSGSASCENDNLTNHEATTGLQVSGLATTPYTTSVGGTDFNWQSSPSTYWNANNATNYSSAKGYIPELPWNGTCVNSYLVSVSGYPTAEAYCNKTTTAALLSTVGGSGGVSSCTTPLGSTVATCAGGYAKPSWQTGTGVPADGHRDIPDVSLFAASGTPGSAYFFVYNNGFYNGGGTSFGSPAMAGIMALVVQKQASAQGLANPVLYKLAATETLSGCNSNTVSSGNGCIFYDTTSGNNSVPCVTGSLNCVTNTGGDAYGILSGYSSTVGFDLATGLGSMNVTNLVNGWSSIAGSPSVAITVSPTVLTPLSVGAASSRQILASGGTPPYSYFVSSGTLPAGLTLTGGGILSGVPTVAGSSSFTISARDSSLTGPYAGSQPYTLVVNPSVVALISWAPSTLVTYTGLPLGAGVLDATSTTPGTITYAYTLSGDTGAYNATNTTVLPAGTFTLTATLTPSGGGASTSATTLFTVLPEHIWVVNGNNTIQAADAAGNAFYPGYAAIATGGSGIAIDNGGTVWSGVTSGSTVSATWATTNANYVYLSTALSGGGLSAPAAIAIDGNDTVWVANGNNSVSKFSILGAAITPTSGYSGGSMSTPTGIAIDVSGNVWISNSGNNSVTEILGAAAPVEPLATAVTQGNMGAKP